MSCKKYKADKMTHRVSFDEEDMSLRFEAITEVAQSSLKGIGKKQLRLTNKLAEHINTLTEAINEVQHTVEAEPYSMVPNDALITSLLLLPMKIYVQA